MKRMRRLFYLVAGLTLTACGKVEMRFDPAPAPVDVGYYTLLFEKENKLTLGQIGVSLSHDEDARGSKVAAYSPLPGRAQVYSRACGVDYAEYIDKPGRFEWDLGDWFPKDKSFCIVDIFFQWELPKGMTTQYPIRGLAGRVYLRRRPATSTVAKLHWNGGETADGIITAQFRALPAPTVGGEPLALNVQASSPVQSGLWQLWGCDHGKKAQPFSGQDIVVSREDIIGAGQKGSCVMFGFAVGPGGQPNDDMVVAYDVYDKTNIKLSATATYDASSGKLCYTAEDSVSLVVFVDGKKNAASNKLQDCFSGTDGKVGFFTHKGRAVYAVLNGGVISWLQ